MNWFSLSFVGFVVLIAALAMAAYLVGIPAVWIAVGALAMLGIGLIVSAKHSRPRV